MVLAILLCLAGAPHLQVQSMPLVPPTRGTGRKEDLYVLDSTSGALTRIGVIEDGSRPIGLQSLAFLLILGSSVSATASSITSIPATAMRPGSACWA